MIFHIVFRLKWISSIVSLQQECIPVGCVLPAAVAIGEGVSRGDQASPRAGTLLGPGTPRAGTPQSRPPRPDPPQLPLGCVPGSDPTQFPPWLWVWTRSPSISPWLWAWTRSPSTSPWVWTWRPPGDLLQGMLGYHLQCMLGLHPPCG